MSSILDYDFGNKLNKFVDKLPKFKLKGCFDNKIPSYDSQASEAVDIVAEIQELSQRLTQASIAVPTTQAYKVATALSVQNPNDKGMKYLTANLATFPEEVLGYDSIEELRQSCLRQFPDSYTQEFFNRDIVRLANQNDMDVDFLTKVAETITSQSDFESKVKKLKFEGSDVLNVDKRQFLLAHINDSLQIEDTFPCDVVAETGELAYIKESHKKYMADAYKAKIAENLQLVMDKNAVFEIPKEIDFRGYEGELLSFGVDTPEYQLLSGLGNAEDWSDYAMEMNAGGIAVNYEPSEDAFIVGSHAYFEKNSNEVSTYEIPEEIDFRTYTAAINLKVGSDRVEYHLLNNLWQDEVTKDMYCAEMKNAGVAIAYNEDDTYSIEKEQDTTVEASEDSTVLDIPKEIDFREYSGEPLYFGIDTPEYQLLSGLGNAEDWSDYAMEMSDGGIAVNYEPSDDIFIVGSHAYFEKNSSSVLENLGQQRLPNIANKKADTENYKSDEAIAQEFAEYKVLDLLIDKKKRENQDWVTGTIILEFPYAGESVAGGQEGPSEIGENFTMDSDGLVRLYNWYPEDVYEELAEYIRNYISNSVEAVKHADIPTPSNMPEQEIYTRLTNETKDVLAKIQSRASELKTLRDEHLQVYGELDEAKNRLAEDKQRISAELSGYLDISGDSFTKICTALSVAETLEAQTDVILNAVTTSIDKVVEANEKAIPEDAKNILDILKHMGTVADNIVIEAKEEITKMSEGVSYVRQALKKKQASIDEGRFWPWIKTSIFGAKKFYGFTDRNVNSFINDYGNLVKILMSY